MSESIIVVPFKIHSFVKGHMCSKYITVATNIQNVLNRWTQYFTTDLVGYFHLNLDIFCIFATTHEQTERGKTYE